GQTLAMAVLLLIGLALSRLLLPERFNLMALAVSLVGGFLVTLRTRRLSASIFSGVLLAGGGFLFAGSGSIALPGPRSLLLCVAAVYVGGLLATVVNLIRSRGA